MKYLKTYELFKSGPQVGDYVICNDSYVFLKKFLNNTIGRFILLNNGKFRFNEHLYPYIIGYKNIPAELSSCFDNYEDKLVRAMSNDEIEFYSKDEKECDVYLASKNYNI